ncbi:MAG: hypothetical protein Q9166_001948 [cf. Caloplaca sp. 2 TL-2023]
MPLNIERPGPERPLKHSLDKCDSASARPAKRQHIPSTPPTPAYSLDKVSQPSVPQAIPPTPPYHPHPSKRTRKENDFACDPAQNKRRVEDWLAKSPAVSTTNCPPQPEDSKPTVTSKTGEQGTEGAEQRPLLEVLQEMSKSQRQSSGGASVASGRSSRPATSHADYRKILRNNGVLIDHTGEKIPPELRTFLDSDILKERSTPLSPEAISEAVKTAVEIADSPEGNVYDLINTALLPIKRSEVGRGGNTPWYSDGLPRNKAYEFPLAAPKPDVHCGYVTGQRSTWKVEENTVIDHQRARRLTQPAKGNCFPFHVFELKSEAMGGTLWQAENQAAGSAAYCVNSARWVYEEADASEKRSVVDTVSFSACVTHRLVVFHVHWYTPVEDLNYMSWIATFETLRHVEPCNHVTNNIFDHCLGPRQTKIRAALARLNPIPEHWKQARPASAVSSQVAGGDDEDAGSNKTQRLEQEV